VWDFLFTYYPWRPGQLRRWHPGPGVGLAAAAQAPHRDRRFYRTFTTSNAAFAAESSGALLRSTPNSAFGEEGELVVALDVEAFLAARGETVRFVRDLLTRTAARPGRFGCFGLHEWAMVYRQDPEQVRHTGWPLRLGPPGTDAVVEAHQIACSHFDAYRFFTPEAAPRNALRPTRASQAAYEQPGCLHAGMDLDKWAMKLSPAVPSDLVLDCLELAKDIRELDMRAAPYDLRELGYEPVPIETPEGKARYVAEQRAFSDRGQALRARLVEAIDQLGGSARPDGSALGRSRP
jgi:hypothetical protein